MSDKLQPKVGELIKGPAEQDAIHVAIYPAIAEENLYPSQRVGIILDSIKDDSEDLVFGPSAKEKIGVVDPFLQWAVGKGQKFYVFLFPGTVTSLRHKYSHPALEEVEKIREKMRKEKGLLPLTAIQMESKQWITEMAEDGYSSFEEIMEEAEKALLDDGDFDLRFGTEMYEYNSDEQKERFWRHFSNLTGKVVPQSVIDNTYFSCSC